MLQEQENTYLLLLSLQGEVLKHLKDGVTARDVYLHALNYIRDKQPELEKHFVKNIGFAVSIFH